MNKLLTFIFAIIFAMPCFADIGATNGVANSATCDSGALDTDSGGAALEAQYSPETINLKWYDEGGTRIATNSCTYDNGITLPSNPTRTGYTFKGWRAIPGTRIEYIESTGTQWIDTGIIPNQDSRVKITVMATATSLGARTGGGSYGGSNWSDHSFGIYGGGNSGIIYFGYNSDNSFDVWQPNIVYVFDLNKNNFYINNSRVGGNTYTTFTALESFRLGMIDVPFVGDRYLVGRIYNFSMWDNGTLVRDFIPIKDPNGVACMYDKVSGQFFYNSGTGDFIAGPEI